MKNDEELQLALSLLKVLKSGVSLVDKTFYHNSDPAYYTKEATGAVVSTMLVSIALYEKQFGSLK